MAVRSAGRRRSAAALAALAAGLALLVSGGCTYDDREPGIFERDRGRPTPTPRDPGSPNPSPQPVNPALPVLGEAVWQSADGHRVVVRLAVHAVRRIAGGTVLDWSLTPLGGPNLRPGERVPDGLDLGLVGPGRDGPEVVLLDGAGRAYRPLGGTREDPLCLCTPVRVVQDTARIGRTVVLQVTFPELPGSVDEVDVSLGTIPVFWRVPVTARGRVPLPRFPVDLARPGQPALVGPRSPMFRYGPDEQVFRVQVLRVVASPVGTSLEWVITSVTGGDGVAAASTPPFADPDATTAGGEDRVSASGPRLRVGGTAVDPLQITSGRSPDSPAACLCTDLRGWPSVLQRPDKMAIVVTNYPPLPPDTARVEVVFAGLPVLWLPVGAAPDPSSRVAGSEAVEPSFWRPGSRRAPIGWTPAQWPTPVPDPRQVAAVPGQVDTIGR